MYERREYRPFKPWIIYFIEIVCSAIVILIFWLAFQFTYFFVLLYIGYFLHSTYRLIRVLNRQKNLKDDSFFMKQFRKR